MTAAEPAIRPPAVAGSFYPGATDVLAETVDRLLDDAVGRTGPAGAQPVRGVVVPHAGYVYSGPIAATAYASLAASVPDPSSVIVLGPSHFEPLRGLAAAPHKAWQTPLGVVGLDSDARRTFVRAGAKVDERVHRSEHSLEVQVPFLQRCFPGVPLLPLAVGGGSPAAGAEVLAAALPTDAVVVISTDLSHYHDAETARRLDARTTATIEALAVDDLGYDDACGADALRLGMAWAKEMGWRIRVLDLRNSADTAGDPARVVGYGAFAVEGGSGV